jgi:hypothetical protein
MTKKMKSSGQYSSFKYVCITNRNSKYMKQNYIIIDKPIVTVEEPIVLKAENQLECRKYK